MKFNPLKLIPIVSIPALLICFQNCSKVGTNGISVDQIQSGQSTNLLPQESDPAIDTGMTTPPKNQDPSSTNTTNTGNANTGTSNTNTTTNNSNTSTQDNEDKECKNCQDSNRNHHHDDKDDDRDCQEDRDRNPGSDKKHSEDDKENTNADHDDDYDQSNTDVAITDAIKACSDPKPLSLPSDNLVLQFNHESIELDANSISSIQGNWGRYVIIRAAAKENAKVGSVHLNHTTLILCNFAEIKEIKGTHNRIIVVDGKIQEIHTNNSNISLVNASVEKSKGANSVVKSYTKK